MSYFSGFVLAVPNANRDAYIKMTETSWPVFKKYGALRMVENWGVDVPEGKNTDFYRATQAKDGESVLFSWIEWKDRAASEEAWPKIMAEMEKSPMPDMPFDGARMFWGGFETIFDSDKA